MNLSCRHLTLKKVEVRDRSALALDTGFDPTSLEGLRLVKGSRGTGWLFHDGVLKPWVTRGVLQEDRHLIIWGDVDGVPEGENPGEWPVTGEPGRLFLQAFIKAWTARAAAEEPLPGFSPSAVLPYLTKEGWAFAFPPSDLRGVLDSLQPLSDRLAWDHFRLPDVTGASSWAFASAALGVHLVTGTLPWAQEEEAHLRQEIRDMKRTFQEEELPQGLNETTARLWFESLTNKIGSQVVSRWKAWALETSAWEQASDTVAEGRRTAMRARRDTNRRRASFWRRRGTLVTAVGAGVATLLAIVGSIVWGVIKPHPSDTWTQEQVVTGYYAAIADLDADLLEKLTQYNKALYPELGRDQEEATNLYVLRQVRIAYERVSPILNPAEWEQAGKPALLSGQMLYGVAGLEFQQLGDRWTVLYRKWTSEVEQEQLPRPVGMQVKDELTLIQTDRGWKIAGLKRDRKPLP